MVNGYTFLVRYRIDSVLLFSVLLFPQGKQEIVGLFHPVEKVNNSQHYNKKDNRHEGTGLGIVRGAVSSWPHDKGVYLMGGEHKCVGGG